MNDELREQLGRLDPMHSDVPVESVTTPSSRARMEQIMNTPTIDQEDSLPASTRGPTSIGARRRRNWTLLGGVAAAAVIAIGGAVIIGNRGDGGTQIAAGPPLVLSLPASDPMAMCIQLDTAILGGMSPAFGGTVTAIDGDTVTLAVDRWYAGGDAATVQLQGATGSPALDGSVDFEVGQQYLVTATEGNVNICGYSGLATPELTAAFEAAFPG